MDRDSEGLSAGLVGLESRSEMAAEAAVAQKYRQVYDCFTHMRLFRRGILNCSLSHVARAKYIIGRRSESSPDDGGSGG